MLVECLWHEAVRLTIDEPDAVVQRLPAVAEALARECGPGPMFKPAEFREAVSRRLGNDDELQLLLREASGTYSPGSSTWSRAPGGDG